jgi:Flp pilus assembly pilin Flp
MAKTEEPMTKRLNAAVNDQRGQALVEYALILFFIAIVCVGVLTVLGTGVRDVLQSVANGL